LIPPIRPIRTEVTDAVVEGIRERGAEAVGLLIVGLARIVIGAIVLALLVIAGEVVGIDVSAVPFAAMTGLSALVSWLMTRGERR
jgi:hypothetical protein